MALEKFLQSLGLNDKEQKVYVSLLKMGDALVSGIAKRAGTKRTTTYHILENLIERGLVSSYQERGTRRFVAETPSRMKGILEGQISALEKYLPQLQSFYNLAKPELKIKLFEGQEGVRQVSEDILNCKKKIVCSLGSIEDVKGSLGRSIRFARRRAAGKIFSKNLRMKSEISLDYIKKQTEELREVRFLPSEIEFPGMIFIYDNKISFISSEEEGGGFIIESEDFSRAIKSMFEFLWQASEKPTIP